MTERNGGTSDTGPRPDRRRLWQTGGMLDYAAWHARLAGSGPKVPHTEAALAPIDGLDAAAQLAHLAGPERRAA